MKSLNVSDVIKESWQLLTNNYLIIGITLIVYVFLGSLGEIIGNIIPENAAGLLVLVSLADLAFSLFLLAGWYRFGLNLVQERGAALSDLFSQSSSTVLNTTLVSLLVGIIVVLGLLLFIVPGIILGLRYSMVLQLVVDQGLGPLDAMAKSAEITSGHKWKLFLLGWVNFGIILLGLILLGVGLIVAIPLTWMTIFVSYEMLKNPPSENPPSENLPLDSLGFPETGGLE